MAVLSLWFLREVQGQWTLDGLSAELKDSLPEEAQRMVSVHSGVPDLNCSGFDHLAQLFCAFYSNIL
jgi:hypothetical protein